MPTIVKNCRICGGDKFEEIMSLGDQALTGVFPANKEEVVTSGPVDLIRCSETNGCGLVQLRQSYDLTEMYGSNYGYRSSLNASMVKHLHTKIDKILSLDLLKKGDLIIDIGSNDATSLKRYPQGDFRLVGIDPTGIKFSEYYPPEIKLIPEFFSADAVKKGTGGAKAKVITSFSMFYDLEDPVGFSREIEGALDDDGIWIFEQSYLPAMLETNSFDTICHEHIDFYSLRQIHIILKAADLKVIDVEFNDVNGGSFSVTAAKTTSTHQPNLKSIQVIDSKEKALGLEDSNAYKAFFDRVKSAQSEFMTFLIEAKERGDTVSGLGASTKGNVLLQYYGITQDLIKEIGEVNGDKFGCYTPGTLIPLIDEQSVLDSNPDYLVVLPWHFRKFFLSLPSLKGRKLVFPLPNFEIVEVK
ncbi:class I SAM-dependent methyltransferase [Amylibacter sp.]|nr:class I SAM-dependent methyltransferase [Amylibacter sp.]